MPELPEVETVARGVDQRVRGERIEETWFGSKPEPFKTPAAEMAEQLPGMRISCVYRVGKHIVFDLIRQERPEPHPAAITEEPAPTGSAPDAQWIVHLGMTGRLLVAETETPLPAHTHGVLRLSSGRELRFVDARRFGRMALALLPENTAEGDEAPGQDSADGSAKGTFRGPGAEPLLISQENFRSLFRRRKMSIKAALLNQTLLHGVGNIYADESLFRAGLRPRRRAARLTRGELDRLHAALQRVLQEAIELGGSSVSDYVDATGVKGFFQLEHRVYLRTGKPCLACGTPIRRIVVAGRGTHYCPACQH